MTTRRKRFGRQAFFFRFPVIKASEGASSKIALVPVLLSFFFFLILNGVNPRPISHPSKGTRLHGKSDTVYRLVPRQPPAPSDAGQRVS